MTLCRTTVSKETFDIVDGYVAGSFRFMLKFHGQATVSTQDSVQPKLRALVLRYSVPSSAKVR